VHNLWIDSKNLKDFGIIVSGENTFNTAEIEYETVSVPGRNGDLLVRKNRMKNINVSYPAFILSDFLKNASNARAYLMANTSYRRIEDDYHTDTFRLGFFSGPMDFTTRFLNRSGETNIVFNCKPQRFFKSGEYPISFSAPGNLYNFGFPALPIIKVSGNGSGMVRIGEYSVQFKNIEEYVMLDCDTQNAYKGTENKNNTISAATFPKLEHGENQIGWSGGITGIEITPRWWTL